MKKFSSLFVFCLFVALIGSSFFFASKAQIFPEDSVKTSKNEKIANQNESLQKAFSDLIQKAQTEGRVRVIVGLKTDFKPEGEMSNEAEREQQRDSTKEAQNALLEKLKTTSVSNVKTFEFIPFLAMEVDADALVLMRDAGDLKSIQEDELAAPTLQQSVPLIGAPSAWSAGFSGQGRYVAILDTGVDKTHQFLTGKVVSEACYSTNNSLATSFCPGGVTDSTATNSGLNCDVTVAGCPHGTHVAGITAGSYAPSSLYGVAKDASLIAIQVFSKFGPASCGSGNCALSYTSDYIKGLERVYALRNTYAIDAVNMSLGGSPSTSNCDAAEAATKAAVDNLRSVNIATVIASGNNSATNGISTPACISTAISVGSTEDGSSGTVDTVSTFSNSASFLSLLAPGRLINSSVPGNQYANYQGTSMAAPHVAGAWAIVRQKYPTETVSQILARFTSTGVPITDTRNNITKPRIRVDAALGVIGGCSTATPITSGQTVSGTLATTDCLDNGRYVDKYSFSGTAGQQITIAMNSSIFDTYLYLYNSSGQIVTFDDDGGGGTNSRIPPTGTFTLPTTGTFTIWATSYYAATTGTYTLNFTAGGGGTDPCLTATPIANGQTLNGALTAGDCLQGGYYRDRYSFSGTAGQQVVIAMNSSTFDTYLYLYNSSGQVIAENDDSGGTTNSRIPPTGTFTLPTTGNYIIVASSYNAGVTGSYTLSLPNSTDPCQQISPISFGQTINGTLTTSDCLVLGNYYTDKYSFTATAGQQIVIAMDSSAVNAYLTLYKDNNVIAFDDNGGGGTNARIPAGSGYYTIPTAGTYVIEASTVIASQVGGYSLSLTSSSSGGCIPVSLPTVSGSQGGTITVPITVGNVSGQNIIAYDFDLRFDSNVVRPSTIPVDATGTLSSNFTITPNSTTPGQLRVAAFGTNALNGSGTLLNLRFDIIGNNGSGTNLTWNNFKFNENSPCSTTTNGRVNVTTSSAASISGSVLYGIGTARAINSATLSAVGSPNATALTNTTGAYQLSNLGSGAYTVTPSKSGEVNGISAFDAALVAQYVAGLTTLTANQQLAGDASNNGTLSAFDAAYIAQTVAGVSNPGIAGQWKFVPASRFYSSVSGSITGQNYEAVMVGDASGNWQSTFPSLDAISGKFQSPLDEMLSPNAVVDVSLPTSNGNNGATVTIPITVGNLTGQNVIAYDFDLRFNQAVLQLASVSNAGTLSSGLTVTPNSATPGQLRVAAFSSTTALSGSGTLLNLTFNVVGNPGTNTALTWQAFQFNEGDPQANRINGSFTVNGGNPPPTISINNVSLNEGNSGTTNFPFNVTLSAASAQTVTVNYATADGTAVAPGDYTATSGTLTFAPGETSKPVNVAVIGDTVVELNETFTVNLSNPTNATILNGQGTGTIINDDVCSYTLTPASPQSIAATGGNLTINVTAGAGCAWTAVSGASWITVTSGSSGTGNGTIGLTITANTGVARNGNLTIAGQNYVINQAAGTVICSYTVNPTNQSFGVAGGNGSFTVTAPVGCAWTAAINSFSSVENILQENKTDLLIKDAIPAENAVLTAAFSEGFDSITTLPASGWFTQNNSVPVGTTGWFQGTTTFAAHSGAANSYIAANYSNTTGTNTISNWLLTPNITFNNGDRITFYTRTVTTAIYPDRLQVRLSTNGTSTNVGAGATGVGDFTTLLLDINPTYTTTGYPVVWTPYTITISGLASPTSGRLAFRYFVENGGPSGTSSDFIGIDTFSYTPSPSAWITVTSGASGTGNGTVNYSIPANTTGAVRTGTINVSANGVIQATHTVNQSNVALSRIFDFDGDGKADIGYFGASPINPTEYFWTIRESLSGTVTSTRFGLATDKLVPADYDGDGKTDVAVFRDGTWYLRRSQAGEQIVQWGTTGDIPVPFDFDGDGKADFGVFRNGTWYIMKSTGGVSITQWGNAGDKPVVADYDGDRKADLGVFRNGIWYVLASAGGVQSVQWGINADKLVPADYNGDGKADFAVFRDGFWYLLINGGGFEGYQWGIPGDIAVPADYDGDGKTDIAVCRNGIYYIRRSNGGVDVATFGTANDKPIAAAFQP